MTTEAPTSRTSWFPREHGAWAMFGVASLAGLLVAAPPPWSTVPALALLVAGFLLHHVVFLPSARRPRPLLPSLCALAAVAFLPLAATQEPRSLGSALVPPALVGFLALLVRRFDGPAKMDALPANLAGALALAGPAWTLALLSGLPDRPALVLWLLLALQSGVGVLLVQTRLPRPVDRSSLLAAALVAAGFGIALPPLAGILWALLMLSRPAAAWALHGRAVRFRTLGRIEALLQGTGALLVAAALRA